MCSCNFYYKDRKKIYDKDVYFYLALIVLVLVLQLKVFELVETFLNVFFNLSFSISITLTIHFITFGVAHIKTRCFHIPRQDVPPLVFISQRRFSSSWASLTFCAKINLLCYTAVPVNQQCYIIHEHVSMLMCFYIPVVPSE